MERKLITAATTALAVVALSACGSSTDSLMAGVKGRYRGTAQMDGVSTRLYSFDVDLSSYSKVFGPPPKALTRMFSGPVTISLWISDDNLPRKITTAMKVKGMEQSTEVTYRDWGKPVNIVAPPASQVGKMPS